MSVEIRNAVVENVTIFIEDHGILTSFVEVRYNSSSFQGFGGYSLEKSLSQWVRGLFMVFGVNDLSKIKGRPCRVKIEDGLIRAIGNLLEEKWFDPKEDLK